MLFPFNLSVIGGGILGLATAMEFARRVPGIRLLVLEKERGVAAHQTGHNSGVIHSGIYYKPGSLKAQTCVSGRTALLQFCEENSIRYDLCGKVIVATGEEELPRLEELFRRGKANGVEGLEIIGPERLREIEPHAHGIRALYAPTSGIIDFTQVAEVYAQKIRDMGGEILTSAQLKRIIPESGGITLETTAGEFRTRHLINCAGLFADRIARMETGAGPSKAREQLRIVPFRGEYYKLAPEKQFLVRALVYPVPDPRFPFLGVHFTRKIHGEVEAGPNAVLAFAREGYEKTDVNVRDLWEIFSYRGFLSIARKYWKTGLGEFYRSISKAAFVKALQKLIPEIRSDDLMPGGAGVRAQAISPAGQLVDDFVIAESARAIHVLNAPSPGATASLAIGKRIVDIASKAFSLA
ncbi:MAG: L-2-hydroxyglutarate oxidase [Deltaproteobacteria bacterium]|nr:L-2-hydroxyglutarate oxidase [Deltaproteobacteria bacterium]